MLSIGVLRTYNAPVICKQCPHHATYGVGWEIERLLCGAINFWSSQQSGGIAGVIKVQLVNRRKVCCLSFRFSIHCIQCFIECTCRTTYTCRYCKRIVISKLSHFLEIFVIGHIYLGNVYGYGTYYRQVPCTVKSHALMSCNVRWCHHFLCGMPRTNIDTPLQNGILQRHCSQNYASNSKYCFSHRMRVTIGRGITR